MAAVFTALLGVYEEGERRKCIKRGGTKSVGSEGRKPLKD